MNGTIFRSSIFAGTVVVFIGAWWAIAAAVADPLRVASPYDAGEALVRLFVDPILLGELTAAVETTMTSVLLAFLSAAAVGIPLGLLMGRYAIADLFLDPWVASWYSIPAIAFVPLTMNWTGITWISAAVTGFLLAVFAIIINVYAGVKSVGASLTETAIAYGASRAQLMSMVILPASLPNMMLGLRLGVARAIEGVIIAEMVFAVLGLGGMLDAAADKLQLALAVALVLVVAAISFTLAEAMKYVNKRAVPWKESESITRV